MALFKKLRKGAAEPVAAPAESIEAMRRRARHRLIGAVVLVLAAVIGFPVLFDTQPRPVAVDIPIEIPDRNKVKPLPPPSASAGAVSSGSQPTPMITEAREPPAKAASEAAKPAAPVIEEKLAAKPEAAAEKAETKPVAKAEPKPEPKVDESAKARALLDGKAVDATGTRYVVQVGAFSEKEKAQQVQQKLERAGLRNYTNIAETPEGKRIRVRAGPFETKGEADKAAEKIKGLDLPVRILTL